MPSGALARTVKVADIVTGSAPHLPAYDETDCLAPGVHRGNHLAPGQISGSLSKSPLPKTFAKTPDGERNLVRRQRNLAEFAVTTKNVIKKRLDYNS